MSNWCKSLWNFFLKILLWGCFEPAGALHVASDSSEKEWTQRFHWTHWIFSLKTTYALLPQMERLYQFLHVLKYFFSVPATCCRAHMLGLWEQGGGVEGREWGIGVKRWGWWVSHKDSMERQRGVEERAGEVKFGCEWGGQGGGQKKERNVFVRRMQVKKFIQHTRQVRCKNIHSIKGFHWGHNTFSFRLYYLCLIIFYKSNRAMVGQSKVTEN